MEAIGRGQLKGMVQTVLGLISPDDLGVTLPHEHFMIDASVYYREPELLSDKPFARQPISIGNLNWVRHHQLNSIAWVYQTLPPGFEHQIVTANWDGRFQFIADSSFNDPRQLPFKLPSADLCV